jgi:hypothetical protein
MCSQNKILIRISATDGVRRSQGKGLKARRLVAPSTSPWSSRHSKRHTRPDAAVLMHRMRCTTPLHCAEVPHSLFASGSVPAALAVLAFARATMSQDASATPVKRPLNYFACSPDTFVSPSRRGPVSRALDAESQPFEAGASVVSTTPEAGADPANVPSPAQADVPNLRERLLQRLGSGTQRNGRGSSQAAGPTPPKLVQQKRRRSRSLPATPGADLVHQTEQRASRKSRCVYNLAGCSTLACTSHQACFSVAGPWLFRDTSTDARKLPKRALSPRHVTLCLTCRSTLHAIPAGQARQHHSGQSRACARSRRPRRRRRGRRQYRHLACWRSSSTTTPGSCCSHACCSTRQTRIRCAPVGCSTMRSCQWAWEFAACALANNSLLREPWLSSAVGLGVCCMRACK